MDETSVPCYSAKARFRSAKRIFTLQVTTCRQCARDRGNSPSPLNLKPWGKGPMRMPPRFLVSTISIRRLGSRPMFRTSIRKWWLNFKN